MLTSPLRLPEAIMSLPTVDIVHRIEFSAAHQLLSPHLSDDENQATYEPCIRVHGHNYVLEATLRGPVDPKTGMVANLNTLAQAMREEIFDQVDHRFLNADVPALAHLEVFTSETLVIAFWELLVAREEEWQPGRLYQLRLLESDDNWVVYRGPQDQLAPGAGNQENAAPHEPLPHTE